MSPKRLGLGARVFLTLTLLSSPIVLVSAERILFLLPLSTKSHKIFFEPLVNALAARNHEVTVLTNEKSQNVHGAVRELLAINAEEFLSGYPDPLESRRKGAAMSFPLQFILDGCHRVIQNETFQEVMTGEVASHFDLIVVDGFLTHCLDGFIHQSGVPFILMTSMPAPSYVSESVGNFLPPSIIPVLSFRGYTAPDGHMGFWQRIKNFVHFVLARAYVNLAILPKLENVYRSYLGEELPGILEIESGVAMIFMNSHYSMNLPRPLLPSLVEIGGIHCRPASPLPSALQEFISKGAAPHGFIFFSVGSLIKIPEDLFKTLLQAFSKLKQRVVVKWKGLDGGSPLDVPGNVLVGDWFSQQDLLGHENIRLFISHGGLLSTQEAVYHAVPILGIPCGIDQGSNIHNAVLQGYALELDIELLTEDALTTNIERILEDPRFYENVQRISEAFRNRPVSPLESAVFWTEYVAKTINKYNETFINSPARRMTIIQYYSYDILTFFLVLLLFATLILKQTWTRGRKCCQIFQHSKTRRSENTNRKNK